MYKVDPIRGSLLLHCGCLLPFTPPRYSPFFNSSSQLFVIPCCPLLARAFSVSIER
jgi:hypothetical protein